MSAALHFEVEPQKYPCLLLSFEANRRFSHTSKTEIGNLDFNKPDSGIEKSDFLNETSRSPEINSRTIKLVDFIPNSRKNPHIGAL